MSAHAGGVVLLVMSTAGTPEGSAHKLTLPHGDPVAMELISAIHRGDLDGLGGLVAERPQLASARMIGRNGLEGGWRTPLHAAADWPGYFPAAPTAVALLLEPALTPMTTLAAVAPRRRCIGRLAAMTSMWQSRLSTVALSSKRRVGRSAPSSTTRSATPAGTLPGCWSLEARGSTSSGTQRRSEWSNGSSNSSRSGLTRPATCPRRSGTLALAANDAPRSIYSPEGPI